MSSPAARARVRLGAIALDFDGVVVESVGIKDEAFRLLLPEYPDATNTIMSYHLAHNAVDRYAKFRHIAERILGIPFTTALELEWTARFDRLTHERVVRCPFVPGAPDLIEQFKGRVPLYLVSATPERELHAILEERALKGSFAGIFSSSVKKTDALRRIIASEGIPTAAMVFIGDSPEDEQTARACGVTFVARTGRYDFHGVPGGRDMHEVIRLVEALMLEVEDQRDFA